VETVHSQIGSGSLPLDLLPSAALVLRPARAGRGAGRKLQALAAALRALPVPVLGRVSENALVLDLRTLEDAAQFTQQLTHLGKADDPAAGSP
jgi:L-seryl-tRNA(Ser) seleniumtransferase